MAEGMLDTNVIVRLLTRDAPHHFTAARHLLARGSFAVSTVALTEVALATYKSHPKLSIEDCVLEAESAAHNHVPLLTFDRKLAAQTSARLVEQPAGGE